MSINHDRIRQALPVESGTGRKSLIRARPDVAEVVVDCVLRRRQFIDIAKRLGVNLATLERFRKKFITPEVEKIVLVEANKMDATALDAEVNEAQSDLENGILGIVQEQKRLYRKLNQMANDGDEQFRDTLAPMMQLLRDQTKSYEAALKVFTNLRDKTTVVLPLSEHPEIAKLMDALWVVFKLHPAAFDEFQQVCRQKRIPLDVSA